MFQDTATELSLGSTGVFEAQSVHHAAGAANGPVHHQDSVSVIDYLSSTS